MRRWFEEYLRDPGGTLQELLAELSERALAAAPLAGPVVLVGIGVLVLGRWWWRRRCHHQLGANARLVTMLAPPTVDPAGAAVLWSNLVGLLRPAWRRWLTGQPHLAFEYLFSETGVVIRLWVPGVIPPGLVERAIEAAWPGSHTTTDPTEPPLPPPGPGQRHLTIGGQLRLARCEALPIRTDLDVDPVRALIGAAVGLGRHEHACVQVLARPVAGRRVTRARRTARHLHTGAAAHPVSRLLDLLTPGPTTSTATRRRTAPPRDPQATLELTAENRAIVTKQRGPQYETAIRYALTTLLPANATRSQRRAARDAARGRAHALASTFAQFTEHNRYARRRLHRPANALAGRRLSRGDLLSVPELAALAHLPTDETIPGVQRAGARALAPPPGIAAPGPDAKPLGLTDAGPTSPVGLRVPDARHHLHVIGATGSGKSTLLGNLILADAAAGRGVVLIDPKGDLVTDLLARLPLQVADRVVLIDADSRSRPPCLNPLDGDDTDLVVDNLVSVFRRVYSAFWGPRTDDVMRAACLTLHCQHGTPSLTDLPKLLADPAYRGRLTAAIQDPILRGFWTWYEDLTDGARAQVIAPLMNKLRAFLLRPFVRDTLAAGPTTIDLDAVLDGGLCLVRIPKGTLGEETTRLIGSLIVARTWQATTRRATTPQPQRRDANLVIDECHNFLNLPYPIEDLLAEARGYRLATTLAHQHLGQLPRELREGISTNARTKIFFNTSPEDARDLARHTTPQLTDHDLTHLGAFHAATRLVHHGQQAEPFTIRTQPLPPPVPGRARQIRRITQQTQRSQASRQIGSDRDPTASPGPRPRTHRDPQKAPSADPRRTS